MFIPSCHPNRLGVGSDPAAQADAREAKTSVEFIQHDVERLLMITEALWTLLKKQHGYTDADLINLITEIDMRDGKVDGRVAKTPGKLCPSCGKPSSNKRPLCIYCGKPIQAGPFVR